MPARVMRCASEDCASVDNHLNEELQNDNRHTNGPSENRKDQQDEGLDQQR